MGGSGFRKNLGSPFRPHYAEGHLDDFYDWRGDVLSDAWDPKLARKKLHERPEELVCDALLDRDIFAVWATSSKTKYSSAFARTRYPGSERKLGEMVKQARQYSFEFLEWKKAFVLKKHWLAHNKSICPRDHVPFRRAHLGRRNRRTFYCDICQKLYD